VFCLLVALCGCDKAPEPTAAPGSAVVVERPVSDRMQDAVYTNALMKSRGEIVDRARRGALVRNQLAALEARARKALAKDATEEQVQAELTGHPERYPGWRELKNAVARLDDDLKRQRDGIAKTIRERVNREAADRAAAK